MESGGVSLEDLEEYYMVVNQTFRSEEEGYKYYNSYALLKGFGVRKEDLECKPDTKIAFRRLFSCSKEGYRAVKHFNATNRKRQPRALSRCGCKARLEIELHMECGEWFAKIFVDEHNHPLVKPDHTAFIRSHRGLSDAQKADVIEYGIGGLRTHQIMEKQHGGYYKVGDGEFFYKYKTEEEGHLQNLFWTDAQSRIDYDAFGGVVVFDSTYRVNKYNLPFVPFIGVNHHHSTTVFGCGIVSDETVASYVWLLKAFLEATQQNPPRSVMTDGDRAMAKAISMVFPGTDHRLCSWHIEQNMIRHLCNPKLGDFRKFVYHAMKVDDFERRWVEFKDKYEITEKDEWINRMYELRKKWSKAYTKGRYFLGMQSNQRSESLNSRLHKNLDRRMSLVDLLEHYDLCLSRIRRNESQLDAEASQTVPFTDLHAEPLERSAARTYTPEMFKRVKVEIIRLVEWEIAEVLM
ncbi:protein FAR1-RELATED SEQUENCE 5 [Brachypodium distachyon]|uniref:protein FAR1-RELATED SEQUENCE 5 n=1 Tax=Brachypodium distachyon TaxID=15368 RepID=UPI00052FEA28|nr:protein FAR1-RELATED SEQUENCE 5 [Brachypodium distachyon]|eukprot:XP_024314911.1 protein FAR1-RELATED SEQUENCE 5 [Brachypodium distachyon]